MKYLTKKQLEVIGDNLRLARKGAGLTQVEIGEKLEKSEKTISRYETGIQEIPIGDIIGYANICHVPIEELISGIYERRSETEKMVGRLTKQFEFLLTELLKTI